MNHRNQLQQGYIDMPAKSRTQPNLHDAAATHFNAQTQPHRHGSGAANKLIIAPWSRKNKIQSCKSGLS